MIKVAGFVLVALCVAQAANPQDEQVVRNTYAKLAYAVSAQTVYGAATKNLELNSMDLSKELQANELRFEISELTSGSVTEIGSKPYSDFVSVPDKQTVLSISVNTENFDEKGKRIVSTLAGIPTWVRSGVSEEDWNVPVDSVLTQTGLKGQVSRYVAATVTVRFKGQSRTYRTLWLFGAEVFPIDLVTGSGVLTDLAQQHKPYPSILTDTSLRSVPAVSEWLTSTQRFEASCTKGKKDVCCDPATMRCGVASEDLRDPKPAPTTTDTPKGGGL